MARTLSRRRFLESAALAGFGLPLLRTAGAAEAGGRLNVASIGCGGKGWSDLVNIAASPHVSVRALCNIDEGPQHLGRAAEKYPQATRYTDWRKLLDAEKLDGVIVSTPDHMHYPIALAAIRRGLHVYCQKPLTHTVQEARRLTEAAHQAGVVTQMGNQIQAYSEYRTAVKTVHDGLIGRVREVYSWQAGSPSWPRGIDRPSGSDPVPAGVHWNDWLGVAPERPYVKDIYHAFNWRGWQDFSNGQLGDFGCHILDPVFMALELTAPLEITAQAPPINTESWTREATVRYVFPGTKHTAGDTLRVTWMDGDGRKPEEELRSVIEPSKLPGSGSVLLGESGALLIPHVGVPRLLPEEKFAGRELPVVPAGDHYILWADACRGEGKTSSHFGYSGRLTETVLLGTIAIRLPGTALKWNAESMQISEHDSAPAMLSKSYRKGWDPDAATT